MSGQQRPGMTSTLSHASSSTDPAAQGDRRPSNLNAETSAEQRKARRAELRQFYGLKGDNRQGGTSPVKRGGDLNDLDSPAFDAKAYYQNLVATANLSELMQTVTKLSADIKRLQGSRHDLVYNHHHQLFEAGDTISHLNSRTPQLLGIMSNLQQSFSEISRLADDTALPELEEKEQEAERWNREVERLSLMILADDHDGIKLRFDRIRDELETASAGNESARHALAEYKQAMET